MKSRPIFLLPAGLFLVSAFSVSAAPGGLVGFCLLGAIACLLPVGFSSGWPKYTGILFCIFFLGMAGMDAKNGIERTRKITVKLEEAKARRVHQTADGTLTLRGNTILFRAGETEENYTLAGPPGLAVAAYRKKTALLNGEETDVSELVLKTGDNREITLITDRPVAIRRILENGMPRWEALPE